MKGWLGGLPKLEGSESGCWVCEMPVHLRIGRTWQRALWDRRRCEDLRMAVNAARDKNWEISLRLRPQSQHWTSRTLKEGGVVVPCSSWHVRGWDSLALKRLCFEIPIRQSLTIPDPWLREMVVRLDNYVWERCSHPNTMATDVAKYSDSIVLGGFAPACKFQAAAAWLHGNSWHEASWRKLWFAGGNAFDVPRRTKGVWMSMLESYHKLCSWLMIHYHGFIIDLCWLVLCCSMYIYLFSWFIYHFRIFLAWNNEQFCERCFGMGARTGWRNPCPPALYFGFDPPGYCIGWISYGEEPLNFESHRLGFTVLTTKACSNFDQGSVRGFVSFGLWIIMNRFCGRPDFKKVRKGRLDWYVHVFCGYSFVFCENYLKKYERYCRLICIDLYWWIWWMFEWL